MKNHILEIDGIWRCYEKGKPVLQGADLQVAPGEVVGLLGRNGAGKTTLLRIALGLIRPQKGSVRAFGLDPFQRPVEVKQRVGYVSEEQALPAHMTVEEVIQIHRALFPSWDTRLKNDLLDRFRLDTSKRIADLSKGQARQAALLCAMAHRPDLLLLDEPAGGLDPATRREFLEAAVALLCDKDTAIVFSSHHMADVERIADRLALLHQGRMMLDAPIDALRRRHSLAVLEGFPESVPEGLKRLDECLRVRARGGKLHAVLACSLQEAERLLSSRFSIEKLHCGCLSMEDLFIELVGRES